MFGALWSFQNSSSLASIFESCRSSSSSKLFCQGMIRALLRLMLLLFTAAEPIDWCVLITQGYVNCVSSYSTSERLLPVDPAPWCLFELAIVRLSPRIGGLVFLTELLIAEATVASCLFGLYAPLPAMFLLLFLSSTSLSKDSSFSYSMKASTSRERSEEDQRDWLTTFGLSESSLFYLTAGFFFLTRSLPLYLTFGAWVGAILGFSSCKLPEEATSFVNFSLELPWFDEIPSCWPPIEYKKLELLFYCKAASSSLFNSFLSPPASFYCCCDQDFLILYLLFCF